MSAALIPLIVALVPVLAPFVVAGAKKAGSAIGAKIPNSVKPVLNALFGAILAYATGSDPTQGVVLAHVAKSVRDQLDKPSLR
jgi:hypothetical protein